MKIVPISDDYKFCIFSIITCWIDFFFSMQAITVKFLSGEMHFNVATLRPFLQHYRTKEKEATERYGK